ncbi:EF-hand domain-containing protein [Lutibaculum baratangense]|nr:EF-hand domain-containing protein [Lutibaculum baratangense]
MIRLSTLSLSALALAAGLATAHAQQGQTTGQGSMMNQQGQGMMQDQQGPQGDARSYGGWGMMPWRGMGPWMMDEENWGRGMMGRGWGRGGGWGPDMMGPGMMMGGGMMGPQMMIIMMDTDGDGKLSLEEFQSMHARMFGYLDENGDGQLEMDEMGPRWNRGNDDN